MSYLIYTIPLSFCAYYLYKRFTNISFNKKNEDYVVLKDDDLYHYMRKEKGYVCVPYYFNNINSETKQIFLDRIKNICIPKYLVCRLEKTDTYNTLKQTKMNDDELLDEITLNGYIPISHKDILLKTHASKLCLSFCIDTEKNMFWVCWNHAIMDGVRVIDLLLDITDKIKQPKINLIKNNWYMTLFSVFNLLINLKSLFVKHDGIKIDMESDKTYTFSIPNKIIEERRDSENTSFMTAYQSIILEKFDICLKGNICVGTIVAAENVNSFNSLGCVPYFINLCDSNKNLSKLILSKLKNNRFFAMLTTNRFITNILSKFLKRKIDILFSGCTVAKEPLTVNNSKCVNCYGYVPYHSAPIYVFSCKIDDKVYVSIGIRNEKIYQHLKKYNWNLIE